MDVRLHPDLPASQSVTRAAHAIESCVHCGFCLTTCPTYLDTRDERDSPRGRIYLVRELLQEGRSTERAQYHLDRCLTCRACETSCPSGVQYAHIADAGREILEQRVKRPAAVSLLRRALRTVVPYPRRFGPLLRAAQRVRGLLPAALRASVPPPQAALPRPAPQPHTRQVVLLEGCVQSCATPRSNQAARLILDRLGIAVAATPAQGCCGALDTHLGHPDSGREAMRRNIDAWWTALEGGAEAVLSTATGCGAQLAEYATALADDPAYADKARRISELADDLAVFLLREGIDALPRQPGRERRVAVHVPCSQMHALHAAGTVRELLAICGYPLCATRDDHLCCGSAGTYSLLQPAMSRRLRERKLSALGGDGPQVIATANVGCQLHLEAASTVPVVHWTELCWEAIA